MLWNGNDPSFPHPTPDFSGSCAGFLWVRFLFCSSMDGETSSAFAVEEIDKVFWEFDMQDFTPKMGRAQEPMPDADMSASPEKTSPDSTDFVPLSASVEGAVEDMFEMQAIPESVLVSALEMDSVAPSVQVSSLTSAPDPHSAPDSAAFEASDTHAALGAEKAHAGESLTGPVVQSADTSDIDGTYMIPDPVWVMGEGRIGSYCLVMCVFISQNLS